MSHNILSLRDQVLNNKNLTLMIIDFLNLRDLGNLLLVNKIFLKIIDSAHSKWRYECLNYFIPYSKPLNYLPTFNNWKKIFKNNILNYFKWNQFNHLEISNMKSSLYHNLIKGTPFPRLHKTCMYIENDPNTPLQLYLIDMLYQEQELYYELDETLQQNNSLENNSLIKTEFIYYLPEIIQYANLIKTNQKLIHALFKYRWVILDDNIDLVDTFYYQIPPLMIIKLISDTLSKFCILTSSFLLEIKSFEEFIEAYKAIYQRYVNLAIDFNDKYQNISIIINYIYDSLGLTDINCPKFSILRICMKIWNIKVLFVIKDQLVENIKRYSEKVINAIFNKKILNNNSFTLANEITHNSVQSFSTANSSMNSFNNSLQFQKTDQIEDSKNEIEDEVGSLSEIFSMINDLLCDEYSVYQMNLTYFENNNEISLKNENSFCLTLGQKIENCLLHSEKQIKITIHKILDNFSVYTKKFIPRFQLKILQIVSKTIENFVNNNILYKQFEYFMSNNKSPINNSLDEKNECNYENNFLFLFLLQKTNNYNVVNYYMNKNSDEINYIYNIICDVRKWFLNEEGRLQMNNKKVEKELKKRRLLNISFSPSQKQLLSFSSITTSNDIEAVEKEMKD